MIVIRAAVVYFALVFAAGFAFGVPRVLWLEPRLGERAAELVELPIMLAVVVFVARIRVRRTAALGAARQLAVGGLAFALMLVAEFALAAVFAGRSPLQVLMAHDPVSGACYAASLVVFAFAPWAWAQRVDTRRGG